MMCRCHRYGTVMISPDCEGTILACLLSYVMLVLHILGQAAPELYSNKCEAIWLAFLIDYCSSQFER